VSSLRNRASCPALVRRPSDVVGFFGVNHPEEPQQHGQLHRPRPGERRQIREVITSEMWEQLNDIYLDQLPRNREPVLACTSPGSNCTRSASAMQLFLWHQPSTLSRESLLAIQPNWGR